MPTPTTFHAASAQAAAIPDSMRVELSSGGTAQVLRLSWLQFEALWSELAVLFAALTDSSATVPGRESPQHASTEAHATIESALSSAPHFVLKLAALSTRLPETELAQWPPCDVLAIAAASLELNFIQPVGIRAFFASVARLGGG
jgi:hypothetical protein